MEIILMVLGSLLDRDDIALGFVMEQRILVYNT